MSQVITIHTDGSISGLQVKPGKGLDLTSLGHAKVQRASEIAWDDMAQAWTIDVLQEAGKGVLPYPRFQAATNLEGADFATKLLLDSLAGMDGWKVADDGTLLFTSYDNAVKVEMAFLDALRVKGLF